MIDRLTRRFHHGNGLFLMASLVATLIMPAQSLHAVPLQGDIRLQASSEGPVWVGQQIELNLELWSNGFSFSGQRFLLPEVDGAYLLQVDSSTIKLTERRDGETWQGLRYAILLYPQQAGTVEIPSFPVEFAAGAGYGSETTRFRIDTPALEIESRLPPGVNPGGLVVSTSDFIMRYQWTPDADVEQRLQLKTGDAITLTVDRTAAAVPGMIFSPLPDFQIDGLEAYTKPPEVNDSANRGSLRGRRNDSVTFICEREGSFEIPAITFQWWDPSREVLNEETIPGISLAVEVNPAFHEAGESLSERSFSRFSPGEVLLILAAALLGLLAGWKVLRRFRIRLQERRLEFEAGERWAFEQVLSACRSGHAAKTYSAINLWMSRYLEPGSQLTLQGLARKSGRPDLVMEAERLQAALISGDAQTWNGQALADGLQQLRSANVRQRNRINSLPPLNPTR